MTFTAVDCQGFAGGLTLGIARAGFEVVAKREGPGGFGVPIVDRNRHLINPELSIQVASPADWEPLDVDLVFGNPPCSAFSGMLTVNNNSGQGRGADHSINSCMWDLVGFAAECDPQIVIMESVQGAYMQGRDLMQNLRHDMELRAGHDFDLTHVLHNNASVGGASVRRRYFMVLSHPELRFGIEPPVVDSVPTLAELIYDIETLPLKREPQRYRRKPVHSYPASLRSATGLVDGHAGSGNIITKRVNWMLAQDGATLHPGEHLGEAGRRLLQVMPMELWPDFMLNPAGDGIVTEALSTHAYMPRRWYPNKAGGVICAYAGRDFIHPTLPRNMTMRECARVLGYPDDWSLAPMWEGSIATNQKWLGKGVSVPCGEWIGGWARLALEGNPGPWRGELVGDREWYINVTNDYKSVYDDRTGERRDSRSDALLKQQALRAVVV